MSFVAEAAALSSTKEDESTARAFANRINQRVRAFVTHVNTRYPLTSAIVVKNFKKLDPGQLQLAKEMLERKENGLHVRWGPGNESWTLTWMQ